MARYKETERGQGLIIPVNLYESAANIYAQQKVYAQKSNIKSVGGKC